MNDIAKKNANGLAGYISHKDELETYKEEASFLMELVNSYYNAINIVDTLISDADKNSIPNYQRLLDTKLNLDINTFLSSFVKELDSLLGIEEVVVYSANKLTQTQEEEIKEALNKRLGKDIYIVNKIDTSLIGGIKVSFNGREYDMSLRKKISDLKKDLLNERGE